MWSTKSADLIGHIKFLPWGQLNGCSVTRPFLSAKGVACETTAWDGDVNVWLRVSYNTLASHCVGGKEAYRGFSSRDHNPYTRNKLAILVYNLYSMPLAVFAIVIKKPTGKRLYDCFNLRSSGILFDSTHIKSIVSISLPLRRSP